MMQIDLNAQVKSVAELLTGQGWRMATAESCTGGWIAKVCTDLAGSSDWFECGYITYSNLSKQAMLGVSVETLTLHGAVSEVVAAEMATGAVARSPADIAVAVTGIAGPGGATEHKPVGMACFGWALPEGMVETETMYFDGDRELVRKQTAAYAMKGILLHLKG